jgi:formate hydrogenlyase subunit 3/multisubunit Na+/H+ antiporter MnhD subunit
MQHIKFDQFNIWRRQRRFSIISSVIFIVSFLALGIFLTTLVNQGFSQSVYQWVRPISDFRYLKLWIIFVPVIGSLIQYIIDRRSDSRRDISIVFWTFISFILSLLLYPQALSAQTLQFDGVLLMGVSLRIDLLGFVMLLLTSFLWLFVMMYSHHYMMHEEHRNRFYIFLSITFSCILGTILAGDLLTMFLFFEGMTLSSFMLVTHGNQWESLKAGIQYLFMGVFGGLLILLAIILQTVLTGSLSFVQTQSLFAQIGSSAYVLFGLLFLGFGIKAGMAPVHIWLPKAHPVAPTPASALLSGIMIKIGAYGILRVLLSYGFVPMGAIGEWIDVQNLGLVLMWLGILTMLIGVFMALQQSHIKKMLAYHSISQMGYIVLAIGIMAFLKDKGSMGFVGALYHIVNHALFKSLLFMVAGVIYLSLHNLNMYELGGLYRRFPITAIIALIASLGIAGMPLLNGFASKSLIHHALAKAIHDGPGSLILIEYLFIVISAGTVTSFIKLFGYTFLGPIRKEHIQCERSVKIMELAMAGIAIVIVLIGLFPNFVLDHLLVPALYQNNFDVHTIEKYLVHVSFFNLEDLVSTLKISLLGVAIFIAGVKFDLFHLHLPSWLNVEKIILYPLNWILIAYCVVLGKKRIDYWNIYNPYMDDDTSMSAIKKEGIMGRLFASANLMTRTYEASMIRNAALIYALVLTLVVILLIGLR